MLLALIPTPSSAAPEVLHVGQTLPRFAKLKPGTRVYLRYTIDHEKRSTIDLWRREVSYETKDGRRLLHISQRWDGVGASPYTSVQDAWFEPETFRPLSHSREVTRNGTTAKRNYTFTPDKITGDPDPASGSTESLTVASPEPAYNFETDIEFLQTLPLARGYEANINFYDPGREPPARYTFTVVGEDKIPTPDGRTIDTWVVSCNYNDPKGPVKRFWFAKSTQVLIREQLTLPGGVIQIKTLLTEEASAA